VARGFQRTGRPDEAESERLDVPARRPGGAAVRARDLSPDSLLALQRSAGNRAVAGLVRSPDGPVVARQAGARPKVDEKVLDRRETGERTRTVAVIEVVGHASPRWRGARSAEEADEKNWRLAERRAEAVAIEVEAALRDLLPDRELVFDRRYEIRQGEPVDALDEPADIRLSAEARGSTETLLEAGARGRTADDDPMRRVDVRVTLHSATETEVEEDVQRTERKPGATRDWALWMAGEAGAEVGAKAAAVAVQLRNRKTGKTGTYAGWISGAGVAAGISIAKTSAADFEPFRTAEPMSFADFDGATFSIVSAGFGFGVFGAEWAKFRFQRFVGGQPVPGGIQVGGISFGGFELNLGSAVYGTMFQTDSPPETYRETTRSTRTRRYVAEGEDASRHRVLFATGSSRLSKAEDARLYEYVFDVSATGL
jgi:hypothetical protein